MTKILVTGGAGFIGSNLVQALRKDGHDVTVFDNYSTSIRPGTEIKSVTDREDVQDAVYDVDEVYHLAAVVGVDFVAKNLALTWQVNTLGTKNVIDACAAYNKKLLYTSSSEVYGERTSHHMLPPFATNKRVTYAVSKWSGEVWGQIMHEAHDLDFRVARVFNTIGPTQLPDYGMVVPKFINQALRGEDLTIYGDGNQQRTFSHVNDTVYQLRLMMDDPDFHKHHPDCICDVGSVKRVKIDRLARSIIHHVGCSNACISYGPTPWGKQYGDMYRVKCRPTYVAEREFENIIKETVGWWKNKLNHE